MAAFKSFRVAHEYTQTNPASPDKVFPLLCPVREAEWVPNWQYRLIYSESGVAEMGCIFTTPNIVPSAQSQEGENSEGRSSLGEVTIWICVDYDPLAYRIGYVWVNPAVVAELRIQLEATGGGSTRSHIRYRYTGLSQEGNREVERYDEKWFAKKMQGWENAINHYLQIGKKIGTAGWE